KKHLNHGVASKVLGGWQVGGVQRYQSGAPTVFNAFAEAPPGTDGFFRYNILPGVPILAPNHASLNLAAVVNPGPPGTPGFSGCHENADGTFTPLSNNNYFNCAAFFDPNASNLVAQRGYVYGDAPLVLGNVRSQHYFNEDFSIQKRTSFLEHQ